MSCRIPHYSRARSFTAGAVAMVGLAACETTGPSETATFVGRWADQEWSGDAGASYAEGRLAISGTHPLNAGQLPLNFVSVVTTADAPGTYPLRAGDASFTYLLGGDVLSARYGIPEGGSGTLTIETITDSTVTGRLVFDAVAVYSYAEPPVGERATFEGTFSARFHRSDAVPSSTFQTPFGAVH